MFKEFFLALPEEKRRALAEQAGTTVNYIRTHLIAPPSRRKTPSKDLMNALADACEAMGASFGRAELLEYFYERNVA